MVISSIMASDPCFTFRVSRKRPTIQPKRRMHGGDRRLTGRSELSRNLRFDQRTNHAHGTGNRRSAIRVRGQNLAAKSAPAPPAPKNNELEVGLARGFVLPVGRDGVDETGFSGMYPRQD